MGGVDFRPPSLVICESHEFIVHTCYQGLDSSILVQFKVSRVLSQASL